MRLNTGDKDWQLAALAAPPSCHGHAQRLVGLLLHSDVFLLTGHTLGKVLGIITKRQHTHTGSVFLLIVKTHTAEHNGRSRQKGVEVGKGPAVAVGSPA